MNFGSYLLFLIGRKRRRRKAKTARNQSPAEGRRPRGKRTRRRTKKKIRRRTRRRIKRRVATRRR